VLVGQDPYIKPNQAMGLSFSVNRGVPVTPSMANIFKVWFAIKQGQGWGKGSRQAPFHHRHHVIPASTPCHMLVSPSVRSRENLRHFLAFLLHGQIIVQEVNADMGCKMPGHGDLSKWSHQGVLMWVCNLYGADLFTEKPKISAMEVFRVVLAYCCSPRVHEARKGLAEAVGRGRGKGSGPALLLKYSPCCMPPCERVWQALNHST